MQVVADGLVTGAEIALLATAFQAVYLPTRVFFIGLAGIYALAPYIALAVVRSGGGWFLGVVVAATTAIGVSLLAEWISHGRLARQRAAESAQLIASLGIYIVIVQLVTLAWGNETKALTSGVRATRQFGPVVLTYSQGLTLLATLILTTTFAIFLSWSTLGVRLRALADNPVQFGLFGHNVTRYRLLAFAIAAFLASICSLLVSNEVGFDPHVGLSALLLGVVAVIIGGRDSFLAPALAGLALGCLRVTVTWFLGARWQDALTFVILVLVLFVRPRGVFGKLKRLEVQQ